MAHVKKYTMSAIGHMANHYGRSDVGQAAEYIIRGNENIDPNLTPLNYNLAAEDQQLPQVDFIHKRMSEIRVQKRADVNVLCDWVITQPKELPADRSRDFFESVYAFMRDRYGKRNVISAYVHMDETTPHMHFAFMPVVADRRRGGEKLCAKELLTRKELQAFHNDLQNAVERDLGIEVHLLNGATQNGNRSITELKRALAEENLQEKVRQDAEIARRALERTSVIKTTEKGFGKNRRTEVTISAKTHQQLLETSNAADRLTISAARYEKKIAAAEQENERLRGEVLSERRRSEQQRKQLKQIRTEYDELLASINAVIDRCPDELKDDLKNELEAERIWQREVKVAKANIKYFTERVDEASSFEDLARVPLAFRPMDMYVDENGKVQEIGIRVYADLEDCRILRYLGGRFLDKQNFSSLHEMNESYLANMDWEKMTEVRQTPRVKRLLGIAQRRAEEQERVPKTVEEFAAMMKNEQKKEQSFELEL